MMLCHVMSLGKGGVGRRLLRKEREGVSVVDALLRSMLLRTCIVQYTGVEQLRISGYPSFHVTGVMDDFWIDQIEEEIR